MWERKNALTLAEKYFRKDEKSYFAEVLPWYYCFSIRFMLLFLGFSLIAGAMFYFWVNAPIAVKIAVILVFSGLIYYTCTRSLYKNYLVVSQYAVYRFIDKSILQFDEIPFDKIEEITIHPFLFSRKRAVLKIKCTREYIHSRPERNRKYQIRHAQENPEKVNPRYLASRKPTSLRLVIQKPEEYKVVLNEFRQVMGYRYRLSSERI